MKELPVLNSRCDAEGVPYLIQRLEYNPSHMRFEAVLFNGRTAVFSTDEVCRSVGLMQRRPNKMQMLEAENNINKMVDLYWV
tara:strand:+ start:555 stop:800 length:246 start_codon:yes stop_codon:yes gene_type:complete